MRLTISTVDYAPDELYDQVPLVVELLREIPGDDRPDYWLGELERPVDWVQDGVSRVVRYVVLAARWEGTRIERGAESLPVGIAFVTDESVLADEHLSFAKCDYVAIGLARDAGGDPAPRRAPAAQAGTVGRLFGTGRSGAGPSVGPAAPGQPSAGRPWWATSLALFCAATVVFLVARDLLVPDVRDTEVWLGLEVHGWLAWLSAPLHWLIFAAGAWGFWSLRPWIWPWASVYAFYVALSHLVWNLTSPSGGGWGAGAWQLAALAVPAAALLWARPPRRRSPSRAAA